MKLLSNFEMGNHFPDDMEMCFSPVDGGIRRSGGLMDWFRRARRSDAVVITNTTGLLTLITIAAKLLPGRHPKIFLWDTNLRRPEGMRSWIQCVLMRGLFRFVNIYMVMHRDLSGYEKFFKIRRNRCRYIPWKANNIHRADSMDKTDEGYVLASGASHRDFETFAKAMRTCGFPAKMLVPDDANARQHNSPLARALADAPGNVKVIRKYGDIELWDRCLAHARIVVVPVLAGTLQPAGIATCLQAMALGKPVVISRGVSTEGILPDGAALLYEPGDAEELAAHVQNLWKNPELRGELGEKGRTFVKALGDQSRVERDIQQIIVGTLKK